MPRISILILLCAMILCGGCTSIVTGPVEMPCNSLESCLPLIWPPPKQPRILDAGCDVVTAEPLRELIENRVDSANAGAEIIHQFELADDELLIETYEKSVDFTWWYLGNRYTLNLSEGKAPIGAVFFDHSNPYLKQVIDCLGAPEWYLWGYGWGIETWAFNIELYFPEQGLSIRNYQFARQENIVIHEDLLTLAMVLVPAGSIEEVVSYRARSFESAQITLEQLEPWPGAMEVLIQSIMMEVCGEYPEICPIFPTSAKLTSIQTSD